jgi:ABC-type multidrug transport system ATPase subunit
MSDAPSLIIPAGTRFGYREGPPWCRRERCLATAAEDIRIGPGLHLFVAPNGSGKTTLLRTLAGLLPFLQGGQCTPAGVHYVADELRADPELNPLTFFRAWFRGEALDLARSLAETLRLDLLQSVGRLSRGNRQKVLLILAEVKAAFMPPGLLLMDEPLTGLDVETRAQVAELWAASASRAVRLVILHELESVRAADSLLSIHNGTLRHSRECRDGSWLATYQSLQA